MNLLPRTYDKSVADGKDSAFRLTSRYGREFGNDFTHLLTDSGKTLIQRNKNQFDVNFSNYISIIIENLQ